MLKCCVWSCSNSDTQYVFFKSLSKINNTLRNVHSKSVYVVIWTINLHLCYYQSQEFAYYVDVQVILVKALFRTVWMAQMLLFHREGSVIVPLKSISTLLNYRLDLWKMSECEKKCHFVHNYLQFQTSLTVKSVTYSPSSLPHTPPASF